MDLDARVMARNEEVASRSPVTYKELRYKYDLIRYLSIE